MIDNRKRLIIAVSINFTLIITLVLIFHLVSQPKINDKIDAATQIQAENVEDLQNIVNQQEQLIEALFDVAYYDGAYKDYVCGIDDYWNKDNLDCD